MLAQIPSSSDVDRSLKSGVTALNKGISRTVKPWSCHRYSCEVGFHGDTVRPVDASMSDSESMSRVRGGCDRYDGGRGVMLNDVRSRCGLYSRGSG